MTALTREAVEYGYSIKRLRSVLKRRSAYLITSPTRKGILWQARNIEMAAPGEWQKRTNVLFSNVTREFYQWWDRRPENLNDN